MSDSIQYQTSINQFLYPLRQRLLEQKIRLAVAESCTGGWVGKVCSDLPGSSEWFAGGVIAYTDEVKRILLNVPAATLGSAGAVSEETAAAMCSGVLCSLPGADIAVAVSGNAGPSGEPRGLVWFAAQRRGGTVLTSSARYDGARTEIRKEAVLGALKLATLTLMV